MSAATPSDRICVGRFEAALPPELEVEGRSQRIYGVVVNAIPLPRDGFDAFWRQRLERLRAGGSFKRAVDLPGGARGVWLGNEEMGIQLNGAQQFGDYALTAVRTGDEGKEASVQKLVVGVMTAYQPDGRAGFCLERGVITSELGNSEITSLSLKHKTITDLNIKFFTETVKYPVDREELSDAHEFEQGLAGAKVERILSRRRSVAEIDGLEERLMISSAKDPTLVRFSWKCEGESISAQIPEIIIIGMAHKENQAQLAEAWDAFLTSLRKVPIAPGSAR